MDTKIYLVTNIDNNPNKVYIGKTKNSKIREQEHRRKFGENIIYNEIDEINSLNKNDWEPIESYWIEQFKAWGFEIVNKNKGGGGPEYQTQLMKDIISNINKGNKYNLNKKQSKKTINKRFNNYDWKIIGNKISNTKKGCLFTEEHKKKLRKPKPNGFMDNEHKLKIGKKQKGVSKQKNKKSIIQMDKMDNFIKNWDSVTEASLILKIKQGDISSVLNKKQKTAGGFKFKYNING